MRLLALSTMNQFAPSQKLEAKLKHLEMIVLSEPTRANRKLVINREYFEDFLFFNL